MVGPGSDTRTIYTFTSNTATKLKSFVYANLTSQEKTFFDNKCSLWSQCSTLDPNTQVQAANSGNNLVNFLRGQTQFEGTLFRDRQFALGDSVNATPLFIGKPRLSFVDNVAPTYAQFAARSSVQNRTPALYVGANDGMLHAFNANTGQELWAYVPRMLMPNLFKLAEAGYATKHVFYVDGAPQTMDIFANGDWHTILVGGLNGGGRGYYAVDITNPLAPQALWEFCSDASLCSVSDANLGLTFGNPIVTKRAFDGRWVVVVTSGYNNVNPGDGLGHLYVLDAFTGQLLETPPASTNVGSTTSPSGLGKINVWVDNFTADNTSPAAYGGDLLGEIFKFDLSVSPVVVTKIAQALDGSNRPQPITTKPELGLISNTYKVLFVGTGRYLGVTDLSDPATQTPPSTDAFQQSIYAFKITPDPKSQDTLYGNLRNPANLLVQQTIVQLSPTTRTTSLTTSTPNSPNPSSGSPGLLSWASSNGWFVDLNPGGASPGERVNIDPQLVLGTLVVATNVPGGDACSVGGEGWVYQFDYKTGQYVTTAPSQILAAKQTGALIVGLSIYQLQSGSISGQLQRSETVMRQQDVYTQGAGPSARRGSWREIAPHH
jgi:type IV pilus assembly protein PilY1